MAREMAKTEANTNEDVIKDRLWRTRGVRQAEIKQLLSVKNLHEKYPPLKSEKWVSKNVFFSCVG